MHRGNTTDLFRDVFSIFSEDSAPDQNLTGIENKYELKLQNF